jgi:hypothetical protein
MSLISFCRLIIAVLIIFILIFTALTLPSGKRIELTQFANSKLLGYVQIESDLKNQVMNNWIHNYVYKSWEKQIYKLSISHKPITKIFLAIQNFVITKITPYYVGVLFYGADEAKDPLMVYIINSRIHQSIFKFIHLPITLLPTNLITKTHTLKDEIEINQKQYKIFQYGEYYLLFQENLCLISKTRAAFEYALSDTVNVFPGNLSRITTLLNPDSDFKFIFDNRFKTGRLVQKYLEQRKSTFDTELKVDFFDTIMQRLEIYSDSIIGTAIQANIKDDDSIKGKWLVIMNSEKSARKIAIVIDGLHQLISKELGNRELFYSVQRVIENNQIISEFEIKGIRKLTLPN